MDVPNETEPPGAVPTPTIAAPWRWAATGPVPYRRPQRGAPTRSVREQRLRRRVCAARLHLWFGWPVRVGVCLSPCCFGCMLALPACWCVTSSGCSFACLQVGCVFVCFFVLLRLLGFCIAWLLAASILVHALPTWNFCSSDKHAQSEGAGARKVPRVGTPSTYGTLRWRMQANPISTAALRLKQQRECCKVLYSR
jgi:hypothetical protein